MVEGWRDGDGDQILAISLNSRGSLYSSIQQYWIYVTWNIWNITYIFGEYFINIIFCEYNPDLNPSFGSEAVVQFLKHLARELNGETA
jgi:hypothetical protein